MDMNYQHIQHIQQMQNLKQENDKLKQENEKLIKELEFMKQIFDFGDSLVFQMKRFTKNGEPVWVNTQKITTKELLELDHDNVVQQLLIEQENTKYRDR